MWGVLRQNRGQLSGKKSRNRVIEGKCTGVYSEGKLHKCFIKVKYSYCRIWMRQLPSMQCERGSKCVHGLRVLARVGSISKTGRRWCSEVASAKSKHQQGSQFLSFGLHSRDPFFTLLMLWVTTEELGFDLAYHMCSQYPWSTAPWSGLCFQEGCQEVGLLGNPNQREERWRLCIFISTFRNKSSLPGQINEWWKIRQELVIAFLALLFV